MKKNLTRVAVMATIVATLVGGFSVSAQAAGTATVQGNGSYGPLNLFQGGSYVSNAATSFGWSDNVIASASISDVTSAFTCPAGSENPAAFLSARDHETIIGDWKAFASGSFISGTQTFAQTNLKPAGLTSGTPGAGAVKAVGGDYSLGVACVSNGGVTVDRVYYRYIHVATDGTGAWTAEATDYVTRLQPSRLPSQLTTQLTPQHSLSRTLATP